MSLQRDRSNGPASIADSRCPVYERVIGELLHQEIGDVSSGDVRAPARFQIQPHAVVVRPRPVGQYHGANDNPIQIALPHELLLCLLLCVLIPEQRRHAHLHEKRARKSWVLPALPHTPRRLAHEAPQTVLLHRRDDVGGAGRNWSVRVPRSARVERVLTNAVTSCPSAIALSTGRRPVPPVSPKISNLMVAPLSSAVAGQRPQVYPIHPSGPTREVCDAWPSQGTNDPSEKVDAGTGPERRGSTHGRAREEPEPTVGQGFRCHLRARCPPSVRAGARRARRWQGPPPRRRRGR